MSQDNFIPIIIGNCNPFRIIAREIDKWNPSLDEINTLSYDYVKLNRNSTALDVNITIPKKELLIYLIVFLVFY